MKTLIGPKERDFLFCVKTRYKYIYKADKGVVLCPKRVSCYDYLYLRNILSKRLFKNLVYYKVYKIYDLLFEYDSSCVH